MNKLIVVLFLFGISMTMQGQSFMGVVKKTANFREKPDTKGTKISSLKAGTKLFVISKEEIDDYYHVIDIESSVEGYVYSSFVQLGKYISQNQEGIFNQVGRTMSSETVIRVFNKSDKTVSLILNDQVISLDPDKKEVLILKPGNYSFRVVVAGKVPEYGTQSIESGYEYIWSFTGE